MNEITFTGNVSKIYQPRQASSGESIFRFDLAVDNGYVDRGRGRWISRTRFQPVVAYRDLARNARDTLTNGDGRDRHRHVAGRLLHPDGSDYPVRRDKLEALDVAVSLRCATAVVEKVAKSAREEGLEHNREQLASVA